MNVFLFIFRTIALCAAAVCLVGCSLLNPPKGITTRSFVLTPMIQATPPARSGSTNLVVGIRRVRVPDYLSGKSFAMRKGTNEIVYLETAEWAEPLENALQSVLAEDLGALIPTDQIRLSIWEPGTVAVEVEVSVERFDVDTHGEGVLKARWLVRSTGNERELGSGSFSAIRKGPAPNSDPQGATALLSGLAADLAHKLAQAIKRS